MNKYKPGNVVHLTGNFEVLNPATGVYALTNATTVTVKIKSPSEVVSTIITDITNLSTGKYYYDYTLPDDAADGVWWYNFKGTGTAKGQSWSCFEVEKSAF